MIAEKNRKINYKVLMLSLVIFFLKDIFVCARPAEQIWSSFSPECLHRLQLCSISLPKNGGSKSVTMSGARTCHLPLEQGLHGMATHQINLF